VRKLELRLSCRARYGETFMLEKAVGSIIPVNGQRCTFSPDSGEMEGFEYIAPLKEQGKDVSPSSRM